MSKATAGAFNLARSATGVRELKVYLTGPTRGLFDYQGFYDAARLLTGAGAMVTMPHDPTPGISLREKLKANVEALLASDLVLLLEGWERSVISTIDIMTADGAGIRCVRLAEISI